MDPFLHFFAKNEAHFARDRDAVPIGRRSIEGLKMSRALIFVRSDL
jgi:hypothetical protein